MSGGTSRTAVLVAITLLATLEVAVALAAVFGGDISERAGSILTTVLGSIGAIIAGLLLLLRVESVKETIENVREKTVEAATKADTAARKVDQVHHDIRNDVLKDKVKEAISEDRHDKAQRDAARIGKEQLEQRRLRRKTEEGD